MAKKAFRINAGIKGFENPVFYISFTSEKRVEHATFLWAQDSILVDQFFVYLVPWFCLYVLVLVSHILCGY